MGIIADLFKGMSEVQLSSVLKERIELAEQKYEKLLQEHEPLQRRVAELEVENARLHEQLAKPTGELNDETVRVLRQLVIAEAKEQKDEGFMCRHLCMKPAMLKYHLDLLTERGLAGHGGGNYVKGHKYWNATPSGRAYIVENKLL